ncbi:hypothetical protein FQN50_001114 [Emmonsiellopsis sp. PD_5]|nr:hypothetical protein FQN50_001114 [Emmonsiellopsis sp. PD_5]
MSEPIPESIPTSQDRRSKRPLKRRALTPVSEQATQIDTLFKNPSRDIQIPTSSSSKQQRTNGSSSSSLLPPPPEIVANVQGSSAGAGSGEFHVYKAARRREYERVRLMEDQLRVEQADEVFEKRREEIRKRDEERTEKNRRKREKKKMKAGKGKKGGKGGDGGDGQMGDQGAEKRDGGVDGGIRTAGPDKSGSKADGVEGGADQNGEVPGVIIHDEDD